MKQWANRDWVCSQGDHTQFAALSINSALSTPAIPQPPRLLRKVWLYIMWIWIWTFSKQKNRKYVHQEKSMVFKFIDWFIFCFVQSGWSFLAAVNLWYATIFRKLREVILPVGRDSVPVFIFIFIIWVKILSALVYSDLSRNEWSVNWLIFFCFPMFRLGTSCIFPHAGTIKKRYSAFKYQHQCSESPCYGDGRRSGSISPRFRRQGRRL